MLQEGGNQKFLSFRDKSIKKKNFNISTRLKESQPENGNKRYHASARMSLGFYF